MAYHATLCVEPGSGRPGTRQPGGIIVARQILFAVLLLAVGVAPGGAAGEAAGPPSWQNDLAPIGPGEWDYQKAAHLLERAGFGGTPAEVERLAAMTPAAAVEWLVDYQRHPDTLEPFDASPIWDPGMDPFPKSRAEAVRIGRERGEAMGVAVLPEGESRRLQPVVNKFFYGLRANAIETQRLATWWGERMLATTRPLEEKLTLFWHGHFATGNTKVRDTRMMLQQNEMLRANANGNFEDLLMGILRDPAMLVYLDNGENVKDHPNENFGRELLELFSLGVGNYTERDIREGARAFTGWTNDALEFEFDAEQHDFGEKTFLGQTGPWDGGDIIRIILEQPAAAEFIECEAVPLLRPGGARRGGPGGAGGHVPGRRPCLQAVADPHLSLARLLQPGVVRHADQEPRAPGRVYVPQARADGAADHSGLQPARRGARADAVQPAETWRVGRAAAPGSRRRRCCSGATCFGVCSIRTPTASGRPTASCPASTGRWRSGLPGA